MMRNEKAKLVGDCKYIEMCLLIINTIVLVFVNKLTKKTSAPDV